MMFRLILRQIYPNDPGHYEGRLAPRDFVPILMNALKFQVNHLIDQCFNYFEKNWSSVICQEMFSFVFLDQKTLIELTEVVPTDDSRLMMLLEWIKNISDLTRRGEIRSLVKQHVTSNSISAREWISLMEKYAETFEYCFDSSRLVEIAKRCLPKEANSKW
ncbi:hypothetical protein HDU81_001391 [Chytriomyces hyalinus]|nr:hypothetical protein HDU81_001391 [Chytriomyces hyalinus]